MFQRHKLERAEKKQYSDPTASGHLSKLRSRLLISRRQASVEMKALNRQFGALHGISSLINLLSFLCLFAHGVWIGSRTAAL